VLHTWDRELRFHPHVHAVVSAGGLRDDGAWVATHPTFLFPHRVMQQMYRGRFLARLRDVLGPRLDKQQNRQLHQLRKRAYRKRWVVWTGAPGDNSTDNLLKYLARYVYQNAISDHRVLAVGKRTVTIRTRGSHTAVVDGPEFVRRFTLHFLPKRFRRVRHYGLLASGNRRRLEAARAAIEPDAAELPHDEPDQDPITEAPRCAQCGTTLIRTAVPADSLFDPCARGPP
jgi:hypothetical protein